MFFNDESEYITIIQRYLSVVGESPVLISGLFDANTIKATLKFKEKYNLPNSPRVDKQTFLRLYEEYSKKISENNQKAIPEGFMSKNKYSNELLELNRKLRDVLLYYRRHTKLRALPFYYEETEAALRELCKICRLSFEETPLHLILERIDKEYFAVCKTKKYEIN